MSQKRKKVLITSTFPTTNEAKVEKFGKTTYLTVLRLMLKIESGKARPNKAFIYKIKKDIEIVKKIKPKRRQRQ